MQPGNILSQSGMPGNFRPRAEVTKSAVKQETSSTASKQDLAQVQKNLKHEIKETKGGAGYAPMNFQECFCACVEACKEVINAVVDCIAGFFS